MKATWHTVFFILFFGVIPKLNYQRTLMNRKINPNEAYVPSNAKNIIYYPIQVKRNQLEAPQQKEKPYQNITLRTQKYKDKQVDNLRRMNEQLKERQEVYIDKLMKLQEGLQNQHTQFIKLQELYTQLFQSYKQKQAEIADLEYKFRETERYRHLERSQDFRQVKQREQEQDSIRSKDIRYSKDVTSSFKEQEVMFNQSQWLQKQKEWKKRQIQLITMNESLTEKFIKLNQKYEKSIQEANSLRNRDKMTHSKIFNQQKLMQQIENWQSQFSTQKETRLKYQYENDFLKNRNKDLENQREELEQLVTYKQNEIAKLRQQKIQIQRQSSQKMMSKSPSNGSRVALKTIQQKNLTIDEQHSNEQRQSENENGLSEQNLKSRQYFSFSRDKNETLQQQLPNFPQQLQIDSLIKVHKNE